MFVTIQDFTSDPYAIPNLDASETSFLEFANKHEREVLGKVLGPLLYNEFNAGLYVDPLAVPLVPIAENLILDKWKYLRDGNTYVNGSTYHFPGFKKVMVPYIYALWLRERAQILGGNGMIRPSSENAMDVSPDLKIIRAYNDFVRSVVPYGWGDSRGYGTYGNYVRRVNYPYYNSLYHYAYAQPSVYVSFSFDYFDLHTINSFGL